MEDTLKTYYGVTKEGGGGIVSIRNKGRHSPLTHHVRYSPDGLNWGHGGPGSNELARCLLLDAFGTTGCLDSPGPCGCSNEWAEANYLAFSNDIISKLEKDKDWKLEQLQICEWVFDNMISSTVDDEDVVGEVEVLA